ncbi:MAG: FAD-binding oxidoreductase [Chloroflexota bacterium]
MSTHPVPEIRLATRSDLPHLINALQQLVTTGGVRRPGPGDDVDGLSPALIVEPATTVEASQVLKFAHHDHLAVIPRGAGTKLNWGNVPRRFDLILSTARLNRVLEHAAGDLIARVEAGTPVERLQDLVAGAGQTLPLDPPQLGATVGGIIAANASGPHRIRYGTARDLLIGVTYILPDGTIARAGGKVVKNVAGYDLCKLFTGSLGSLVLLAEVIVRLHPLPATSRTILLSNLPGHTGLGASVQAVLHSALVPSAIDFVWQRNGGIMMVRFEGVEPGVIAQTEAARTLLQPYGAARVLEGRAELDLWDSTAAMSRERVPGSTRLKVSALPADLPQILSRAEVLIHQNNLEWRIMGHAGSGIAYLDLHGTDQSMIGIIRELRQYISVRGGSVVAQSAPLSVKREIDVWGDPAGDAALQKAIKDRFDPRGILSPGRPMGRL